MEEWRDKRAVAAWFAVSPRTVERWVEKGCPVLRLGRSSASPLRFRISEVEAWLYIRSTRGLRAPERLPAG